MKETAEQPDGENEFGIYGMNPEEIKKSVRRYSGTIHPKGGGFMEDSVVIGPDKLNGETKIPIDIWKIYGSDEGRQYTFVCSEEICVGDYRSWSTLSKNVLDKCYPGENGFVNMFVKIIRV